MRPHTSDSLKVLIARKGKISVKLSLRPLPLILGLSVALAVPFGWMGTTLYTLHQRNSQLSASASEVLEELEVLDAEVEQLRQRAGLPHQDLSRAKKAQVAKENRGQGGPLITLDAEEQLMLAKQQLPQLTQRLERRVKPALVATLKAEADEAATRPTGMPTQGRTPISSEFGPRPGPFGGGGEFHNGIDLIGDHGSPIYATATGIVDQSEYDGGYGYHVIINHGNGLETLYAHLSKLAVAPKTKVIRGQLIGYMGSTGRSTGTHLHYAIYLNQKAIDPKPFMVASNGTTEP